ncbi:MAG: outer membrane protein transport protein [Halieaceae bacterium]|nr:outer membrane protein transport protein [Halieaceae bacterium]
MSRSLLSLSIALVSLPVSAGGLWLSEYNQPTMGRAAAGEAAGTGDASDAFFNPAAMSRHEQSQLMVAGGVILPQVEFDVDSGSNVNGTGDGGDAGELTPSASIYYTRPINDRWTFGIGGLALTGSALDYDDDWVGRFEAQEVNLLVIGAVPSLSYRVTDKLSVGLAVPVMYSDLELEIAVPALITPVPGQEGRAKIDGDDVHVAASGSFAYEFNEHTRIGGRVTSKFEFDYDGEVQTEFIGSVGVNTELTLATVARLGLAHDFNARWSGYASLGWDNWSQMDEVFLSTRTNGVALQRNWQDTYHYGVGVDYRMNDRWTLRTGIAYDTNPIDDDEDRTADMPIDEQFRFALGADYKRDNGSVISYSLVYADYGDAELDNSAFQPAAGFTGEYGTNEIWFFSVSYNMQRGTSRR